MQATVREHRTDVAVLHLRGELDADTAGALREALDGLVTRTPPRIVVDLSDLRFCDSMGLGTFISAYLLVSDRGGWVRLAGANPFLGKLIQTVGLTRYMGLYADVEGAVHSPEDRVPGRHVTSRSPNLAG
jgi:anti-sigma B factor antagonist